MYQGNVRCEIIPHRKAQFLVLTDNGSLSQTVSPHRFQKVGYVHNFPQRISSFLKTAHQDFRYKYSNARINQAQQALLQDAKELSDFIADEHNINQKCIKFTPLQEKLLKRDLNELATRLPKLEQLLKDLEKLNASQADLTSIFKVFQAIFSDKHLLYQGSLTYFINELAISLPLPLPKRKRLVYYQRVTNQIENLEFFSSFELLVQRLKIRLHAAGYPEGSFKPEDYRLVKPLIFCAAKLVTTYDFAPKPHWSIIEYLQKQGFDEIVDEDERGCFEPNYIYHSVPFEPRIWTIVFLGKKQTIFEGGILFATITIELHYKSPKVRLLNRIFHPNVSEFGIMPPDQWSDSALPLSVIVESTLDRIHHPSNDVVGNLRASKVYDENPSRYEKINKEFLLQYY